MRIQKRQCLLGILPGKLFLSIGQVSICKIVMGVGRIGISQQVELEDFDCRLRIAFAQMARGYDVDRNFRPQRSCGRKLRSTSWPEAMMSTVISGHSCALGSFCRASVSRRV